MPKPPRLDDTASIILSNAANRPDQIALPIPGSITASEEQVKRKLLRLIRLGLLEECAAKLEDGLWRKNEEDRHLTLRITVNGFAAIGLETPAELNTTARTQRSKPLSAGKKQRTTKQRKIPPSSAKPRKGGPAGANPVSAGRKVGKPSASRKQLSRQRDPSATKTDLILKVLGRPKGATLAELTKASGWQAHSVRGFQSAVVKRKLKLKLVSEEDERGRRCYRIRQKPKG